MSDETIELTACPECGAPAQHIAELHLDRSPGYRYVPPFRCGSSPDARCTAISALQEDVKRWTAEKGWKDDRSVGDLLMLMVSELAEALEEYRDWHEPNAIRVQNGKPEGIPIELADLVIRILSFCGKYDVDLQDAVLRKMAYNETRPHRHGGKRV